MSGVVSWIRRFIRELRRRRVIRVAVVYAGTAFVLLQLGEILVEPFGLPGWTLRLITLLLVLGFPLAVGLAWVFDVTEVGLVRTQAGEGDASELGPGGKPFTSNAIIIGLLAVAIGLLLYPGLTGPSEQSPSEKAGGEVPAPDDTATARLGPRSVAVLPFTYLSAEDSTDYFSLGMTDELLSRLAQIEDLSVVARTSVMQYQSTEKTAPEIGKELGVAHLVEGSVQKAGGKVRIQAQLIDAETGNHLWAEGFTRPFRDVLDLQVDLARRIAGELKTTLMPEAWRQMAGATRVDSAAYALYLQGRKLRFQETPRSVGKAFRLLRRSVSIDSIFAPAWAVLSTTAMLHHLLGQDLPGRRDAASVARTAARRAVEIDSASAEARIAMGTVLEVVELDFPAAGPHFQRAVDLSPGLGDANREYGLYFMRMGQFDVADRYFRKAVRLDPGSAVALSGLARNELFRGNYKQATQWATSALSLNPDRGRARDVAVWAYIAMDSLEAAKRIYDQGGSTESTAWKRTRLEAHIQAGHRDSVRTLARDLLEEAEDPGVRAVLYGQLGQIDRAVDAFSKIDFADETFFDLKIAEWWAPLRDEPMVQEQLKKRGLDEATVQQTMEELSPESPDRPT